jgi:hypothetical protein
LPAGYEEEDPYEDEDLSEYPDWWRKNVETFREFLLRPYRPSRFSDDVPVQAVIDELEAELDTTIRMRTIDPQDGGGWQIWVSGEPVQEIDKVREPAGFTRYFLESGEFRDLVLHAVEAQ